jgi:hypothetical protein
MRASLKTAKGLPPQGQPFAVYGGQRSAFVAANLRVRHCVPPGPRNVDRWL